MTQVRWYVAHTKPNEEGKARQNLQNQDFAVYLPLYLRRRRHARRVDWIPSPLFPGYLFVSMDLDAVQWRVIRSTIGIAGLVCQGDRPTPVPEGIVEAIQSRADEHGMLALPPPPPFDKDDSVLITKGALQGVCGLYQGTTDEHRVTILLQLLGRDVRIRVPLETVRGTA